MPRGVVESALSLLAACLLARLPSACVVRCVAFCWSVVVGVEVTCRWVGGSGWGLGHMVLDYTEREILKFEKKKLAKPPENPSDIVVSSIRDTIHSKSKLCLLQKVRKRAKLQSIRPQRTCLISNPTLQYISDRGVLYLR